jgi:hypothetical protein
MFMNPEEQQQMAATIDRAERLLTELVNAAGGPDREAVFALAALRSLGISLGACERVADTIVVGLQQALRAAPQ